MRHLAGLVVVLVLAAVLAPSAAECLASDGKTAGPPVKEPVSVIGGSNTDALYAHDINRDGLLDIIGPSPDDSDTMGFRVNLGNNTFGAFHLLHTDSDDLFGRLVKSLAIDLGQYTQVIGCFSGSGSDGVVSVRTPDNGATWDTRVNRPAHEYCADLEFADFSSDGVDDVILAEARTTGRSIWLWTFSTYHIGQTQRQISAQSDPLSPNVVAAIDLNQDGFLDVVTGRYELVAYRHPNITGSFTEEFTKFGTIKASLPFLYELKVADVNGDGLEDLVYASSSAVEWLQRLPSTTSPFFEITPRRISTLDGPYNSMCVVDVDQDGDVDIVTMPLSSDLLEIWENDGAGAFHLVYSYDLISASGDVLCADLNGDGVLDYAARRRIPDTSPFEYDLVMFAGNKCHPVASSSPPGFPIWAIVLLSLTGAGLMVASVAVMLRAKRAPGATLSSLSRSKKSSSSGAGKSASSGASFTEDDGGYAFHGPEPPLSAATQPPPYDAAIIAAAVAPLPMRGRKASSNQDGAGDGRKPSSSGRRAAGSSARRGERSGSSGRRGTGDSPSKSRKRTAEGRTGSSGRRGMKRTQGGNTSGSVGRRAPVPADGSSGRRARDGRGAGPPRRRRTSEDGVENPLVDQRISTITLDPPDL